MVAKFGLIDYMKNDLDKERLAAPDLKQFDTNAKIFNQIKESSLVKLFSTGMGMNSSEIKFTQAVVGLYQNVYLLKLPWVDQIELHLKNGTWFQNELTPEMLKSDIELVIHNNLKEKHEVKDLNPFQLGFYGLTVN